MMTARDAKAFRDYRAAHFRWEASGDGKVATITLDRPGEKNPLTFESYAELRDLFRALVYASDVKARRDDRRRRQLQLGRRRARDHRPADANGRCRSCSRSPG